MLIAGLQKSSLLDYPKKIAAIVFTQGCNFRCGYCHNPELLHTPENFQPFISVEDFLNFLDGRKGKLDGVVITGGEPCLQSDLTDIIKEIKNRNFAVKLDTNGTSPNKIKELLNLKLIDYIAMDIKAPLEKYHKITGTIIDKNAIKESIDLIINSKIDYEFRTTVIASQLSFDDFEEIGKLIKDAKQYFLQKFVASTIYNKNLMDETTYSDEDFEKIIKILEKNIENIQVR